MLHCSPPPSKKRLIIAPGASILGNNRFADNPFQKETYEGNAMKFKEKLDGDVVIFELSGKVMTHEESVTLLHGRIHENIHQNKKNVVVDLRHIEMMGSVGLGMLISALTTIRNAGGRLVLANITTIQNLIAVTRLNTIFESYDSLEAALASFKKK
jgi:anti-sigma B factor antagonist